MPWKIGSLSETIKKKVCKYLLQRYLGDFFQDKVSFEQLTVDLFDGTASLTDVHLDVLTLNEIGQNYNLPVEFVDGYIANININVPWLNIFCESTYIEVQGLVLTIQPKQRLNNGSMFDSTWSSMATSMQLAQECLKQDLGSESEVNQAFEGLEIFAQAIETVLCRIKVRFIDTVLRVEHVPKDSLHGVAIEMRFKKIDYFDEAGTEESADKSNQREVFEAAAFSVKKFFIEGFSFYTDEFPTYARTYARSASSNESEDSKKSVDLFTTAPVSPDLPPHHTEFERPIETTDPISGIPNASMGPNPILAGKFLGRQEIRLTLKQQDLIPGPKVDVELNLNLCTFFLTPRQVHVLINLAAGLLFPGMEDDSNVAPSKPSRSKPMEAVDFIRVEEELQKQMHPLSVGKSLEHRQGWSTHCLDDSDEDFLPMNTHRLSSSIASDSTTVSETQTNDDLNASFESACSGNSMNKMEFKYNHFLKGNTNMLLGNTNGSELTHYKVQISTFNIFVLHDDMMTLSAENNGLVTQSSVDQMKNTAEKFFADFVELSMRGSRSFGDNRNEFANMCKYSHIRLSAYPVSIEGNEKTVASICTSAVTFSCGAMEIVECLSIDKPSMNADDNTWNFCDLLAFERKGENHSTEPSFRMKITHAMCVKGVRRHRPNLPKTEVQINLEPCHIELDISIVDRISDLLNPQSIYKPCPQRPTLWPQTAQACFNQAVDEGDSNSDYMVNVKIAAPLLSLYVRFPIADLRALHDMDRLPWWKRNIRPDILQLDLTSTVWNTTFSSKQTSSTIEVRWKEAEGYYQASAEHPKIHFLRATADVLGESNDAEFNRSRLLLKINPVKPPLVVEEDVEENYDSLPTNSIDTIVHQLTNSRITEPSPFSSRKVVYENQHRDKNDSKDPFSDKNQMVMPGDKNEMNVFMETTSSNARFHFVLNLPDLTACLPDKDFYEILYNRIINDLFLWEPAAPKPRMTNDNTGSYLPSLNIGAVNNNVFHSFSPKLDFNADLESNTDSEEDEHIFYSVYEQRKQRKHENPKQIGQNKVAVTVTSTRGRLTIFPPVKEMVGTQEKEIPNQCGEIHLQIEEGLCYILSGFQGQREVSYICLQLNKGAVFHKGAQSYPTECPSLQKITNSEVDHLLPTIYHSQPGLYTKLSGSVGTGGDSLDMVTMAIKVHLDSNSNIKTFKVALGIREGTLQYRTTPALQSCIEQFADFFNVPDHYVAGYKEPDVVTELHLHLWSCAVDYRPLYLPLRTVLTVESLSISSNITTHAKISLLRFIGEDISLFLSKNCHASHVDLKRDYVEVIDINFCDLSKQDVLVQREDKDQRSLVDNVAKEMGIPYKDIRATIDGFHIRTCSDSFCALQDLIAYCVNYGDVINEDNKSSTASENSSITDENLRSREEEVHNLMAEAMRESNFNSQGTDRAVMASPSRQEAAGATGEVFLFPDEAIQSSGNKNYRVDDHSPLTVPDEDDDIDSGDDSFLILEDDPGVGIMPKSGEPEVRILTTEPISVIENYFAIPNKKTDQLQAPKGFPLPEERYTLQEMSIVWHIHGGSDFASNIPKKERRVRIVDRFDDYSSMKVSFNSTSEIVDLTKSSTPLKESPSKQKRNWKLQGGPGREHDTLMELQLNKVRFQYEKYPSHTPQAMWQILLIQDVEIRDRLASSQINKFLYQYSSESVPRQTHANMVVIKAVHSRPEPQNPTQECAMKVSMLPLRLNIDQDALLFLYNFFSELTNRNSFSSDRETLLTSPVLGIQSSSISSPIRRENSSISGESAQSTDESTDATNREDICSNSPVFFRSFTFSPEVLIRLDYHGKHVDMEQGTLAGLIMGLGQLNCSEIRLKRLGYRHGLLGVDKVFAYALNEWLQDIKKKQLHGLLGGVGPMHSLLQLVQGVRDLFWLPVEQYKKNGRILRGLQRGANSFTTSTAMAVLELTNRLVQTIQCAAETAYDMVSPGPSVKKTRAIKSNRRKKPSQPADIREGMASAYQVVKEGISDTARVLVSVASEEHRHKGIPGAVGGVLRQIPPTVVKPIIIASEATSNVLGGMRHQLQPDVRREAAEKWR